MFNVEIDVTSVQLFKAGETLRITVEIYADTEANGSQVALMHDPKNREPAAAEYDGGIDTGEFLTSVLTFSVPFLLDI